MTDSGWAPQACTLPTEQQPLRVAEFNALFADALLTAHRTAPTRLRLVLDGNAEDRAAELTRRETECCSFFTFTFTRNDNHVYLDVEVPDKHADVLDALAEIP
ncbi:hypothetical protein NLX83_40375 [Allokutzneria sp. A3M-2-11 16]|uniref:hypothetical protein n=1 Tax=Allokutzneria sp. A3M-2-11 16 TaxID=2962043 RepID=UPI0020B66DC5|nr:hypothetical protein [Allokutzneria sp. A3M-2-11 16]MCP3805541.1 hypothetical protein [Allokutzneria sp. A3M-2-11 16]